MKKKWMIFVNGIRGETERLLCDPIPVKEFGRKVHEKLLKTKKTAIPQFESTGRCGSVSPVTARGQGKCVFQGKIG